MKITASAARVAAIVINTIFQNRLGWIIGRKKHEEFRIIEFLPEFFHDKGLEFIESDYPHHPQPKLATKRMQKRIVTIRYLSSDAMICPPS